MALMCKWYEDINITVYYDSSISPLVILLLTGGDIWRMTKKQVTETTVLNESCVATLARFLKNEQRETCVSFTKM